MSEPDPPTGPPTAALACPHCYKPVALGPDDAGQVLLCPHCGGEFTLPNFAAALAVPPSNGKARPQPQPPAPGEFYVYDDSTPQTEDRAARQKDELDELRIRTVSHLRRAAIRSRSYMMIGLIACLVGAVQLFYWAFELLIARRVWRFRQTAYVIAGIVALRLAWACYRRAAAYHREIARSSLPDPDKPPDFGPLSDGSQHWRDLRQMHDESQEKGNQV